MNYNRCILVGNLTRDIETKFLNGGTNIASSGIACNRKYKTSGGEQREDVLFLDWSAFGKTAEILAQYSKKGDALLLEGRLKLDTWEAKDGSGKRSKISLVVENFQFLGGKQQDRQDDAPPQRQQRAPSQRPAPPSNEPPYGDEQAMDPNDIPF